MTIPMAFMPDKTYDATILNAVVRETANGAVFTADFDVDGVTFRFVQSLKYPEMACGRIASLLSVACGYTVTANWVGWEISKGTVCFEGFLGRRVMVKTKNIPTTSGWPFTHCAFSGPTMPVSDICKCGIHRSRCDYHRS